MDAGWRPTTAIMADGGIASTRRLAAAVNALTRYMRATVHLLMHRFFAFGPVGTLRPRAYGIGHLVPNEAEFTGLLGDEVEGVKVDPAPGSESLVPGEC
jgi:hypothetical protein